MVEHPLPQEVANLLPGAAAEGAALVGVQMDVSPNQLIAAIDRFVATPQKKSMFKRVDNWNERAMPLGALWGIQLQRRFDWEWVMLEFDDDSAIAVFDRERTVGVYPFHYVFGCIENGVYPTIELAFNMLEAGQIPQFQPREYVNLMDGVRHIVPPL